jgi:hypothetical protein
MTTQGVAASRARCCEQHRFCRRRRSGSSDRRRSRARMRRCGFATILCATATDAAGAAGAVRRTASGGRREISTAATPAGRSHLVEPFEPVGAAQLRSVPGREAHVGENVGFGVVHQRGELRHARPGLIGNAPPLGARGIGGGLGEGGARSKATIPGLAILPDIDETRVLATLRQAEQEVVLIDLPGGGSSTLALKALQRSHFVLVPAQASLPVVRDAVKTITQIDDAQDLARTPIDRGIVWTRLLPGFESRAARHVRESLGSQGTAGATDGGHGARRVPGDAYQRQGSPPEQSRRRCRCQHHRADPRDP